MQYDFIPPFINGEITLTVCRVTGSEMDGLVDYEAHFPDGSVKTFFVTADNNSDFEHASALFEAATWLWIYERTKYNGRNRRNYEAMGLLASQNF